MASFATALVIALAATTVEGRRSRPSKLNLDDLFESVENAEDGTKVTSTSSKNVTRSFAKQECKFSAFAQKYEESKDANIAASVEVWKEVCSAKPSFKKIAAISFDTAFAYAEATAAANGGCTSISIGQAKAKGCGFASASADAAAEAIADAMAEAQAEVTAGANPYCSCVDVTAFAEGISTIKQDIFADAYAYVEATACSSGNQVAAADAYVQCYAQTVAKLLAVAYAKIAIKGGCYVDAVEADIVAFVDSQNLEEEECIAFEETFGPAITDIDFGTDTAIQTP